MRSGIFQRILFFKPLYCGTMPLFTIEKFTLGEEHSFSALVRRVFDEFVAPGYTAEGNRFFCDFIEPSKIRERSLNGNILLCAKHNETIIGIIEIRDGYHICLLFVEKAWQGKGVARALFNEALRLCRDAPGAPDFFEVNASPFSEEIYARLGFKKVQELQEVNGMKFVPMRMDLEQTAPDAPIPAGFLATQRMARTALLRLVLQKFIDNPMLGLFSAIVIALISSVVTIKYIASLQSDLQSMYGQDLIGRNYVQTARIRLLSLENDIGGLFLLSDSTARDSAAETVFKQRTTLEGLLKKAKPLYRTKRSAAWIANATKLFAECGVLIDSAVTLSKSDRKSNGYALYFGKIRKHFEKIDKWLSNLDEIKLRNDIKKYRAIDYGLTISIVFTLATLLATIIFKIFAFRRTRRNRSGATIRRPDSR
jgi:GNAT superfamily N-acetyltransferase